MLVELKSQYLVDSAPLLTPLFDEIRYDVVGRSVSISKPNRVGGHVDVSGAADVGNAPPWDASCQGNQQ